MRRRKKMFGIKLFVFIFLCVCVCSFVSVLLSLDTKILPPVLAAVDNAAKTRINKTINTSLANITQKTNLSSEDLYNKTTDESGMLNTLSINTVLVNELCSSLAVDISEELDNYGEQTIKIPVATLLNIQILSNKGPSYPITILPKGHAIVDYETKFEAVGINQINFQLWLKIDTYIQIVNPIQERDIYISRKVSLVNTVFSGKVPEAYYEGMPLIQSKSVSN